MSCISHAGCIRAQIFQNKVEVGSYGSDSDVIIFESSHPLLVFCQAWAADIMWASCAAVV